MEGRFCDLALNLASTILFLSLCQCDIISMQRKVRNFGNSEILTLNFMLIELVFQLQSELIKTQRVFFTCKTEKVIVAMVTVSVATSSPARYERNSLESVPYKVTYT